MGGTAITQTHFVLGEDDNEAAVYVSDFSYYLCDEHAFDAIPLLTNFHLRIQISETSGKEALLTAALFYNTVNDPATAIQVTTNAAANAVAIVPSISSDVRYWVNTSHTICPYTDSWLSGEYIDSKDAFDPDTFLNQQTGYQACLQFTGNAAYKQTYYFWIKHSDGTVIDSYLSVATVTTGGKRVNVPAQWNINVGHRISVPTQWNLWDQQYEIEWQEGVSGVLHRSFGVLGKQLLLEGLVPGTAYRARIRKWDTLKVNAWSPWHVFQTKTHMTTHTAWEIIRIRSSFLDVDWAVGQRHFTLPATAWGICGKSTLGLSWGVIKEQPFGWGVCRGAFQDSAWRVGRYRMPVSWGICAGTQKNVSWQLGRFYFSTAWKFARASFDIEWAQESTQTVIGSATDVRNDAFVLTGLRPSTTYQWRVRVHDLHNSGLPSVWSYWKYFTTEPIKLTLAWTINRAMDHSLSWSIKLGTVADSAWWIINSDFLQVPYKIFAKTARESGYHLLHQNSREAAWVIEKIIPPPINRDTIEIAKTSAKFIWEPR